MPNLQASLDLNEVFDPDGYAMGRIRYHVDHLVRQKIVLEADREDFEQEMCIRLLRRLDKYDSSRSQLNTYIANCVRYDAAEITRRQFNEKSVTKRDTVSLDVGVGESFGRHMTLGDLQTRSEQVRGRGKVDQDDELEVDLHEDFKNVIESLPPDLKKTCEKLLDARNPSTAIKDVCPSQVRRLRLRFTKAGLHNFF